MIFYNQIKREFSPTVWRTGQSHFREDRVRDVQLEGSTIHGRLADGSGSGAAFEATIETGRGTILQSRCTCGAVQNSGRRCEHVAALSIWVVERGSLLRARVRSRSLGSSETEEKPAESLPAEGIALVRGLFQDRMLTAISVEAAIRYLDPDTGERSFTTLNRLIREKEHLTWRASDGRVLKLSHEFLPVLGSIEGAKLVYQGPASLESLARILSMENHKQIVLHENIQVALDPEPLKLKTLRVGSKHDKNRTLSFEFENSRMKLNSDELHNLSAEGKLSPYYAWKGDFLYRLSPSLNVISQYANRSGVAAPEGKAAKSGKTISPFNVTGFGALHDDEAHPLHPLAAYRLSLELEVENFVVDPDWHEFHEWKKTFERKRIPALPETDYGFALRDYQTNGLSWMWSLSHRGLAALLADDMGLGKTHQVLAFLSTLYRGAGASRPRHSSLVIAPTSVLAAWGQKLKKYDTGLKWSIFHGHSRSFPKGEVDLVLTTYGILQRESVLRDRDWHVIVLDEAQAIKNASTISSRASRMLKSKFRIAMTGTPIENQSTDLWAIMEFLLPGYLGSLPRFKRLYGSGREKPSPEQAQALKRLVSPFLLRRTKTQVLKELPEKTEEVIYCEMTPAQKKAYRSYLASAEAAKARRDLESGGKIDYANILALLTRLKQTCDHPRLPDLTAGRVKKLGSLDPSESGKWEALTELLHEALGSSLKVVIFTQYLGMMDVIGHYLKSQDVGYTELRGDSQDRAGRLERFATDPECKVFVCSLLAGGLGIDLTSASVCIHLDRWWNPAKENQATDRLHRIGQTRGVQVFKLQIPDTVEDRIAGIIESKLQLSGSLIEESPLGLKVFSRKELLELLMLND